MKRAAGKKETAEERKDRTREILKRLARAYPHARTALNHENA